MNPHCNGLIRDFHHKQPILNDENLCFASTNFNYVNKYDIFKVKCLLYLHECLFIQLFTLIKRKRLTSLLLHLLRLNTYMGLYCLHHNSTYDRLILKLLHILPHYLCI